ncbi:hypothetical protein GCM10010103_78710 [Streptomyces paradoxus]|uniref:Uncharacterized protein n=1 Tax=Streptomyces paradoxus TaxID=66375 RepID=A0A7W9TJ48_9ACTN|nr:hypothetical protein [Streptomyces paradoxus]
MRCTRHTQGFLRLAEQTKLLLAAGLLAQIEEAPKPYAGLAWLSGHAVPRCDRALRGEQILDREPELSPLMRWV